MITNVLTKKQGELSLLDAGGIALAKPLVEAGLNLVGVGNNNLLSAGVKGLGAGLVASMIKGKAGSIVASSMVISAVDDILGRFLPGIVGNTKATGNSQVVGGSDSNQGALPGVAI